ncbi:MAG: fused MFS/spermidine synthase [Deltaproteobacteria bacterium]
MFVMFFLFGLASLAGQIVLLREILVIFHGTEISIGIFYGAWLVGIGVGASAGAWLVRRWRESLHDVFLHSLSALGFSLLFQVILIRHLPALFGASPAELTPLRGIVAAVPIGTFLTAFLTGFLFPVGCQSMRDADDRVIAWLYVFEALGSLIGGVILTVILLRSLPPLSIVATLAVVLAVGAMVYGLRLRRRRCLVTALPLLVFGLIVLSPIGAHVRGWSIHARWASLHPGMKLLVSEPTPYQQVELARLGNQISLFGNGKIVSSFPDPYTADRLTAIIMAEKPDAKRFLLIGGGIGSVVSSLLRYPVQRVDIVEPDPWAFRIAETRLPKQEAQALKDPRVHMIFMDGRFYMNRIKSARYNVIVSMIPDPVSAFWNRYYTLEFFRAVSRALTPKGIFVTGVTSAENFWGSEVASYDGSVYHTLRRVFPSVLGTPGDITLFLASRSPHVLTLDPTVLKQRYRKLGKPVFDPSAFDTLLPPERTAFVANELKKSPHLINTDFKPISSSLAMILWGRFSGTGQMEFLNTIRRGGLKIYLIPLIFVRVARVGFRARWGPRDGKEGKFQAIFAMAAVGATAMGVQIVLIYAYQSLFGYVFERIGLFAAIFMTGLVAGGIGSGRALTGIKDKAIAILCLLVLFGLLCLILPAGMNLLVNREPWQIEAVLFAVVFLSGILTGAVFPLVASRHLELGRDPGASSGWTDAADHYGAAVGAAVTGTLLVPLLGMKEACIVLALLVGAPIVLMLTELLFRRVDPMLEQYRPVHRSSFPFVRVSWFLISAVAAAMTWSLLIGPPGKPPTVRFPRDTLKQVSGSSTFDFKEQPFPHYVGHSHDQPGFTISMSTMPVAGDIRGYGGPINLLASVSDKGIIRGVRMVESKETPSYLTGMDAWLSRLKGRSLLKPLEGKVDALTGATITSRAAMKILEKTGHQIARPLLGLQPSLVPAGSTASWGDSLKDVRLWVVLGVFGFFLAAFYSRSRIVRLVCLAASFVVLGLYLNAPFTSLDAANLVHGQVPASGTAWRITLFAGALLISAFWGQAFCGFLCPFGALQEFIGFKALRVRASYPVEQAGRYLKFVLLALLMCLFLVTDDTVWFSFSPLQHFFRGSMV